ncbi:peptide chain release factor N(5)-glutamine methyltransferase [Methylomonas sp. LL1]|uniref:peptide chain release factor N(5)-glutamine methyltransferase n=1 Tax=Methylomonas sp. LL1 TaxID=2785785 RepID=UPI0018C38780|nr:peptide chain release factor N(5)-glutamine methyltransferase [Methylomonas sp. LL1]QPK63028.1 peptide chain release factor N(5)-glutamine methyltransferase [Methylomonas sp. LL1]
MSDSPRQMPDSICGLLSAATEQLAAASESAILDTEVLLCHCLRKNRSFLRTWPDHQPTPEQAKLFWSLIERRRQGMPIAYLTGQREFWSRNFSVGPDVLIPRPDSELLIELSLEYLPAERPCKIIDLGTGSGILAITLAAERPLATVIATDISPAALNMTRRNAEQLNTANVSFLQSHWFDAVVDTDFDLVISNPPYIAENDPHLGQGDVRFEPDTALISAEEGLKDIRLLAEQARRHLKPNGHFLVEHGYNQEARVQAVFKQLNYRRVTTHTDLSGTPRVTSGLWNPV